MVGGWLASCQRLGSVGLGWVGWLVGGFGYLIRKV
jgi:hypothetical protein